LYGCETWSLILREENGLRVFENRVVLGRASGLKRDEMVKGRRKLHNEELKNFKSSAIIIRMNKSRMAWARHVARMEKGNAHSTVKPRFTNLIRS
jgi:hypothetical protein